MSPELLISPRITDRLPAMVRNELHALGAGDQEAFLEDYERKTKSIPLAYVFLGFWLHYAYVGKWGLQVLFWFTLAGFGLWWLVDLFRIPSIISNYNRETAITVMRNLATIIR